VSVTFYLGLLCYLVLRSFGSVLSLNIVVIDFIDLLRVCIGGMSFFELFERLSGGTFDDTGLGLDF
jgi:hypothetical protein